jgi:NAD(P)-dependent dehydrogenase (short-subunit alcohol dehydrogenase family)
MHPRTILVTGATDGIGLETATALAKKGHRVILHGRRPERLAEVHAQLSATAPGPLPTPVVADLSSLAAVRQMAKTLTAAHPHIDVLLHNAGVYAQALTRSADGHELTVAVNHLAPYVLTHGLLESLKAAPAGRVITVSSVAHGRGEIDFERLKQRALPSQFNGYALYAESKLMNVLFANELARRLAGTRVTSNSLHPGVVSTKLLKEGFGMNGPDSHEDGAATSVFLATDDSVAGVTGAYFVKRRAVAPSHTALDLDKARRLWELSDEVTRA